MISPIILKNEMPMLTLFSALSQSYLSTHNELSSRKTSTDFHYDGQSSSQASPPALSLNLPAPGLPLLRSHPHLVSNS